MPHKRNLAAGDGGAGKEPDAATLNEITTSSQATLPVDQIRVGERHRKDLGDIASLAASIADVAGLLQPVVITPAGDLIDGQRRLIALRVLGQTHVPVHVVDIDAIARGELAANVYRKDFTPSEMVAIAATVERRERELAEARQTASLKRGNEKPVVETFHDGGKTRDKVAAPLGISGRTLEKAKAVVAAAEAEPGKYNHLVEAMDRTGRVNGVFKRLKVAQQAALIRSETPPLPGNGPYRVIVADPPWPYEIRQEDPSHRSARPYPTMSIKQICGIDVASLAHDDCILWLWTTCFHMRWAYEVLDAWGFEDKSILTWCKDRMGTGDWLRYQTEHCIMATRGKPIVTLTNQTTRLDAPMQAHSRKPVEFYDLVESLCPAPRFADLFSRYRHNEKWDCHGDEAPAAEPPRPAALQPVVQAAEPPTRASDDDDLSIPSFLLRRAEAS
jgi:N6-adenosine-specific RNA methylase IME4